MREARFIDQREQRWTQFEQLLSSLRRRNRSLIDDDFPGHYRRLCNDLAIARSRGYSLALVHRLEQLVLEGHSQLYRPQTRFMRDIARFLARDFPRQVRSEWRLVAICSLLFFGPMVWLFWHIGTTPEFVYRVLSPQQIDLYERMYSGDGARLRGAGDDFMMFSFYIMNNIGVALRTFAGGLVFGLGSWLILLFNGIQIGAVAAHLSFEGLHRNFSSFVIGHGALELPAIVLAGVAGSRLGLSLIRPGRYRRLDALKLAARQSVRLLYGVIFMLLLAAGLEAFWSASTVSDSLKYLIGSVLWLSVIAYFLLAGRASAPDRSPHAD